MKKKPTAKRLKAIFGTPIKKKPSSGSLERDVSRLLQKAEELQKLRSMASERVMDAELAYEDVTRQCKEAWREYYKCLKQEPANDQAQRPGAKGYRDE